MVDESASQDACHISYYIRHARANGRFEKDIRVADSIHETAGGLSCFPCIFQHIEIAAFQKNAPARFINKENPVIIESSITKYAESQACVWGDSYGRAAI
jgi:hypothetical protein